jgi:beta-ureidopropionase
MTSRKPGPRAAVVGTCTLSPLGFSGRDDLLEAGLEMVDRMAARAEERGWSLDMFLLPEHSCPAEHSDALEIAEELDGKTVTAFAQKARRYGTYGAVPVHLIEDGRVFNCVVLLGRDGKPAGTYRKVFPVVMPDGRLERGVTPGRDFPIFDLDFGRVGVQICFDVSFPAGWEAYGQQEAELVLFSTDPPGGLAVRGYARRHGYYVVSSTMRPPSMIVDPTGREVARTDSDRQILVARFDLDYRVMPSRYSWTRGEEMREKYGDRLVQDWSDVGWCTLLTSTDPDMPVGRIVDQEGLEPVPAWHARNIAVQDAARGGPPPSPSADR